MGQKGTADIGQAAVRRKRKWLGTMCQIFSAGSVLQMLLAALLGVIIGLMTKYVNNYNQEKVRLK